MVFSSIFNKIIITMKNSTKIFLIIITAIMFNSCGTQKIDIIGKPGTEIYSCDIQKISQITNSGRTTIKISKKRNRNPFTNIFLSKNNNDSSLYIPFVLNFKKKTYYEAPIVWIASIPLGLLPATIIYLYDEQYNYRFTYLPEQQTNQDIVFTPLKQTAEYKTLDKSSQNISKSKANTERRRFSSGSSQSNNDPMSVITGRYSGKGELLDGSDVIEEYTDLSIVIKKKSENTVSVEVLASDGYSYFDEEMIYSVTKQDEQFVLKQKGANSRIVIKNGNLSYTNHSINDGETVFTLKITADK